MDVKRGEKCTSKTQRCLFYDIKSESLNIEKCLQEADDEDEFYGVNKDFAIELVELMAGLEEKKQCSGGISDPSKKLPLYLFSNVNNGVPKYSCHEFIVE